MPLHVSTTHASLDECGGLISARGKLNYRVTGPAALLLPALRDIAGAADGARDFDLAHILALVEERTARGSGLDGVDFFAHVLSSATSQFGAWIDALCEKAKEKLLKAASDEETHVVPTRRIIAWAADALLAEGLWSSDRYEFESSDFESVRSLWQFAVQSEAEPDKELDARYKELPASTRAYAAAVTMDRLIDDEGGAGCALWRIVEMASGPRIRVEDRARAAAFVLTTLAGGAFKGVARPRADWPDFMGPDEAVEEALNELRLRAPPPELRVVAATTLHARQQMVANMARARGEAHELDVETLQHAVEHRRRVRLVHDDRRGWCRHE